MVEAGEDSADGLENVTDYTEKLKAALNSSIRVAALHGKMKGSTEAGNYGRIRSRQIDVLVSTTVIEVGINVPNATVMLVEMQSASDSHSCISCGDVSEEVMRRASAFL